MSSVANQGTPFMIERTVSKFRLKLDRDTVRLGFQNLAAGRMNWVAGLKGILIKKCMGVTPGQQKVTLITR